MNLETISNLASLHLYIVGSVSLALIPEIPNIAYFSAKTGHGARDAKIAWDLMTKVELGDIVKILKNKISASEFKTKYKFFEKYV